jgi:hypothetical protein
MNVPFPRRQLVAFNLQQGNEMTGWKPIYIRCADACLEQDMALDDVRRWLRLTAVPFPRRQLVAFSLHQGGRDDRLEAYPTFDALTLA